MKLLNSVVVGIPSLGQLEGLRLCLLSIALGSAIPRKLILRMEGSVPAFGDFYLEQISEVFRLKGCEFQICISQSNGIRASCDALIDQAMLFNASYLVIIGDDVILEHNALETIYEAALYLATGSFSPCGYICGNKWDVNNRRGYGDFSNTVVNAPIEDYAPTYLRYSDEALVHTCTGKFGLVRNVALDAGFSLLCLAELRRAPHVRFQVCAEHCNAGGEDNAFGLACLAAGIPGTFCLAAKAMHLEKPKQVFSNESVARAESLLRLIESKNWEIPQEALNSIFRWIPRYQTKIKP